MKLVGYSLADMLPAYPGKDERYLDRLLRDNALALSRPVIAYGLLGIHPCRTRFFNVSEHGFRMSRPEQPWPPSREKKSVFFFGGSTALGFNIEDSQTIPARVQQMLESGGVPCEVYNFGSGNYTSRHEALRFLDLVDSGAVPDCAIFLDGYNDSYYAFGNRDLVRILDHLYQREKARQRASYARRMIHDINSVVNTRKARLPTSAGYVSEANESVTQRYVSEAAILEALESSNAEVPPPDVGDAEIPRRVWDRYLDSVTMIRALAGRKGVNTLFAWQPIPFFRTTRRQRVMERLYLVFRYGAVGHAVYNWLQSVRYPSMAHESAFLNLSDLAESVDDVLYVDMVHYSASFSALIAAAIAKKVAAQL